MPRMRSRLRSEIPVSEEFAAILAKIKALYDQRASRLKFEIGSARFNATEATDVTFDPSAPADQISFQRPNSALAGGGKEETYITAIADDGAFEVSDITLVADVAGSLNSKYFTFEDPATTHKYYVWFNINSAGVDPAVGGRTGIQVAGATGATAATLATAARLAVNGSTAATYFTVSGATTHLILTSKKLGNAVNTADGAAPTAFTFTLTQGHSSALQSKYFTLYSASDATAYYAWFNVNSEGVDPAVGGKTGIPVALAGGESATAVATALAAALDAQADFVATSTGAQVDLTNAAAGESTDVADGAAATGFTFSKAGELEFYSLSDIVMIKRLRNKKWLIKLNESADAASE